MKRAKKKKMSLKFEYSPQPRQEILHGCRARQILFGGAAGGGKSTALFWDVVSFCMENPGLHAYLFRRKYPELEKTHIASIKHFQAKYPQIGRYNETHKRYDFLNGSLLNFCHAERLEDVDMYLSAEMHYLGIDEAVKFIPLQIIKLRARVRLGNYSPPQKDFLPRFVMSTNPGGPAHSWIKQTFIDPEPAGEKMFVDPETGWNTIYIPSRITDNKYIDEGYDKVLSSLPPDLARAYLHGDWDVVEGQALETLSKERHMLRPFEIPRHWTRFMCVDWGTAKPYAVCWFAVSDGVTIEDRELKKEIVIPKGALIMYREKYGWNGNPDMGCRTESHQLAKEVLKVEDEVHDVMDYRVGDTNMWSQFDGPSPAERMKTATDGVFIMRKAKKDRRANYQEFRARLADNEDGQPMIYFFSTCRHFWRTVPQLQLDSNDPDKGVGPNQEDHIYDAICYGLASRPMITTEDDLWREEYEEARRLTGQKRGAYAT